MQPSLMDKLRAWVSEYPAIKNEGWTDPETDSMADALWEFLADEIGPAQEKLLEDLSVARHRADQAERNELRAVRDLERFISDNSSS